MKLETYAVFTFDKTNPLRPKRQRIGTVKGTSEEDAKTRAAMYANVPESDIAVAILFIQPKPGGHSDDTPSVA